MSSYKRLLQIVAWLAVAAWMIVIFSMSHQAAEKSSEISKSTTEIILEQIYPNYGELSETEQRKLVENTEYATRKIAHMSEYFILSVLLITALLFNELKPLKRAGLAVAVSCLYASTDEIHQLFIVGRSGKFTDVLIDTAGAALAAAIYLLIIFIISKRRCTTKKIKNS